MDTIFHKDDGKKEAINDKIEEKYQKLKQKYEDLQIRGEKDPKGSSVPNVYAFIQFRSILVAGWLGTFYLLDAFLTNFFSLIDREEFFW